MKQPTGFHGEITYTPTVHLPDGEIKKVKTLIVGHSETGHVYDVDEDGRDMKSLVAVEEREKH